MSDMDDVILEFLRESEEGLDAVDSALVELEADPSQLGAITAIFRTMHTIKGTCGFLGFGFLEGVAHRAENLLAAVRDGKLAATPHVFAAVLGAVDAIREHLAGIERSGEDVALNHEPLFAEIDGLESGHRIVDPIAQTGKPAKLVGDLLVEKAVITDDDRTLALQQQSLGDSRRLGEILTTHGVATSEVIEAAIATETVDRRRRASDSTIRVDVDILDSLMNLIGELVLTRNEVVGIAQCVDNEALGTAGHRLAAITSALQDEVMRVRMQPIGNVWAKIPRVVRDLAKSCGKEVVVEMEGADSELDKTILDAIKDPLTHLVRNAVDHGIESPKARVAAGKHPDGKLTLRAYHESGTVVIEIKDDGAGIDAARIRTKLVEKGIMASAEVDAMTDRRVLDTIFLPGFSTAERATTVSGRGVGMDVVRTSIESIRGSVELETEPGKGTTFVMRIPLTLAIVPALMIRQGGEHYAIEQSNLLELVRLEGSEVATRIEYVHSVPVLRLRGKLLELVELAHAFKAASSPLRERSCVEIVVIHVEGREFGVVVDAVDDTQDVVVKALGHHFDAIPIFAGATIRADGTVALILDVRAVAASTSSTAGIEADLSASEDPSCEPDALTVRIGRSQVALPLASIARLEEFDPRSIETVRGQLRVQYRGQLLPIIDGTAVGATSFEGLEEALAQTRTGPVTTVVCVAPDGSEFGLVVDEVLDVVSLSDGIADEAIISGTATAIVDATTLANAGYSRGTLVGAGYV